MSSKTLTETQDDKYPSSKKGYRTDEHLGRGHYGYVILATVLQGAHKNVGYFQLHFEYIIGTGGH